VSLLPNVTITLALFLIKVIKELSISILGALKNPVLLASSDNNSEIFS
jgi:hypothetical protein